MDEPNPYLIRLGMGFFLLFVLSGFKSCSEVKYSLRAKDTTARVTKIYEEKDRHDNHVGWTVAYDFHNDDTHESQKGYSVVSDDAVLQFAEGQTIPIQYCGQSQLDSRIQGESNMSWVYIFLGSLAFCVIAVAILSWQSMREEQRGRPKKSRSTARK